MQFYSKKFDELSLEELYELLKARQQVFLLEQGIIRADLDDIDKRAMHCFLKQDEKICAYIRAHYEDENTVKIGRVLSLVRGIGIGKEIMQQTVKAINKKMPCKRIIVDAQASARGYYEKMGFSVTGNEFFCDGVLQFKMEFKINGR